MGVVPTPLNSRINGTVLRVMSRKKQTAIPRGLFSFRSQMSCQRVFSSRGIAIVLQKLSQSFWEISTKTVKNNHDYAIFIDTMAVNQYACEKILSCKQKSLNILKFTTRGWNSMETIFNIPTKDAKMLLSERSLKAINLQIALSNCWGKARLRYLRISFKCEFKSECLRSQE